MPELPEVQTIIDDLRPILIGARINNLVTITRSIWLGKVCPKAKIAGNIINDIRRKGKYIIITFGERAALIVHLGMTGRLTLERQGKTPEKHTHFIINFDKFDLHYNDIRRFGFIDHSSVSKLTVIEYLAKLGPDPFEIDAGTFAEICRSRNRAIKQVLMDQTLVSGLGNIYSDESLFRAGIHPLKTGSGISESRLEGLYHCIIEVLTRAIEARGSSISDYVDGSGRSGSYQNSHSVYGRGGKPCVVCGASIKRKVIGGRSAHYCPRCQR